MADTYRILALDGGGIRGLMTSRLLERIEDEHPGFLAAVDLFAGTSTGGILALALAAGLPPGEVTALYRDQGPAIFADDTIFDALGHADKLVIADYRNAPLKKALEDKFGTLRLGDLDKKVVVSTFQLDSGAVTKAGVRSWKPKFFHNYPEASNDCSQLVVDVALRTSAAPTYFPVYQGYVDGGVESNNPAMCALAQALDPTTGNQPLERIALLSVGTGLSPKYIEGQTHDWGYAQWAKSLIGIVMGGVSGVADFQCRQVLRDRYRRLDVVLPRDIALDNTAEIPFLDEMALAEDLADTIGWLDANWA